MKHKAFSCLSLIIVSFATVFSSSLFAQTEAGHPSAGPNAINNSPTSKSLLKDPAPQLGKNPIKEVIAAMTLKEKSRLVVGMGLKIPGLTLPDADPEADKWPEKVPGAAGRTHPIPRLGIPSITLSDGPAGIRIDTIRNQDSSKKYYATAFPVATLLASSWDTALVKKVGAAFGREVLEYGADILLAPALNIHRNPLGGRNFEYYSEDPLVAGSMAAAIVKGIQSNGVGTSIKHFAANNQETDRMTVNTVASQRALREIYLKGFEIAVKQSNPWTVMSSYNLLNGVYTSQRSDLLTTILRKEWGFKGLVMSDWFAGNDPVEQMKAGNDLIMPGSPAQSKKIESAVNNGRLDRKDLDRNVEKILQIILHSPEFNKYTPSGHPDLEGDALIAREAAADGMVLLKNANGTLPLKNIKNIAVFGNNSYDLIAGGTGSGDVNKPYTISLAQGLADGGYNIEDNLRTDYNKYISTAKASQPKGPMTILDPPPPPAEMACSPDRISRLAEENDIAILTIGRNAGEGKDRKLENDYYLSVTEKDLISNIAAAFHAKGKKLIIILNIGGVIEIANWRDQADAILLAWQPGMEGGHAITDILSGKTTPCGKLASSFPMDYKDVPSAGNFPGKEFKERAKKGFFGMPMIPAEVVYEEGIYIGYRYYNTFGVRTAYEFGYGLSYTHFTYDSLQISGPGSGASSNGPKMTISIHITNTGAMPGKEIVQVYLSAPAKTMDKPAEELKAFAKTKLLQPGESQTLNFALDAADLASFDTNTSSWIAEAGDYTVNVAASAEDKTTRQTGHFKLPQTIVVEKDHKVLTPQKAIRRAPALTRPPKMGRGADNAP